MSFFFWENFQEGLREFFGEIPIYLVIKPDHSQNLARLPIVLGSLQYEITVSKITVSNPVQTDLRKYHHLCEVLLQLLRICVFDSYFFFAHF